MNVTIQPGPLRGVLEMPASKSCAHRLLIAAALSDAPCRVSMNACAKDVEATVACLTELGANLEPLAGEAGFLITPIGGRLRCGRTLNCGESGATLRFLLPVVAALGAEARLTGSGRLPYRPNAPLTEALRRRGARIDSDTPPMRVAGRLQGGEYAVPGDVSSQFISGLLFALPLCGRESEIVLTSPLQSAAYAEMTREALRAFGLCVQTTGAGYLIPGGQRYRAPGGLHVEADWSAASFWLAANAMGHEIALLGLNAQSLQPDCAIEKMLSQLGGAIDISGAPDTGPALAVAAACHRGDTRIAGAARLRLKESDRIHSTAAMLRALGCEAAELEDGLQIRGGRVRGGVVDGFRDHRIVMAAAVAATVAESEVTILGAEAVDKSYPAFFADFERLGGKVHVQ